MIEKKITIYDSRTGEGIEVPVSAFGMKKARGYIRKIIRAGHEFYTFVTGDDAFIQSALNEYGCNYEADIFFCDFDEEDAFPVCDCDIDEECPECSLFTDEDIEDVDNCTCHNTRNRFFQEHGSCEWCYFIG